jgi:hypothetical protein
MSTTFNLTNTAAEVNTAIQAVVGADTTPTNGSANMVTSDGVFDYVATEVGNLSGKTVTTESTGIINTDNDGSLPTSAAVVDYVANYGKPAMGSLTSVSAGTYTAATDLYITLTSTCQKTSHNNPSRQNLAAITIDSIPFTVHIDSTTANGTIITASASFFVKKGETYVLSLPSSTGIAATAYARTFNFTP